MNEVPSANEPAASALREAEAFLEARREALGQAAVDEALRALRLHAGRSRAPKLRMVTVLFVDVVESTRMLGRLAPEDGVALVNGALERFSRIVRLHGGEVLRYTGDGLKACFGVHATREDDAVRAVQAGLRILGAAAEHAEHVARPMGIEAFDIRVGVHSGMVLLGNGIEADRTAMGATVHIAARMEQSAPIGRMLISEETCKQVSRRFVLEARPPLLVKGLDGPMANYLVVGEMEPHGAADAGPGGLAVPMIGRAGSLQRLVDALRLAHSSRRAAAVLVVGEAGIGKTRLRHELHRTIDIPDTDVGVPAAMSPPITCLRAVAHPTMELQPYGLLRQLVTRWLGIPEEPLSRARECLVDRLSLWLKSEALLRARKVGHLLGFDFADDPLIGGLGAAALREQAFDALAEALRSVAAASPLLLELEDLHWADVGSVQFVQSLAAAADVPMLVLLSARPAFLEQAGGAALAQRVQTIVLRPLEAESTDALADALLEPMETVPPVLRAALVERSAGNPYYMEQLVRMWLDDGVIDGRDVPWVARLERMDDARVPQTLVGVLQARLDALPTASMTALQLASIVGETFWTAALAELDPAAPAALGDLLRRGLVVRQESSAFSDTEAYAFEHQLMHEVTYGTVLRQVRREGHARIARWLASRAIGRGGDHLVAVAEHFEKAGEDGQALVFYERALQHASERFAHDTQLELIDRVLALPASLSPRLRFRLLEGRHKVHDRLDRRKEAHEALAAMHDWAEQCDSDLMRAEVAGAMMIRADHEGRIEEARRWAVRCIELAGTSDDPAAAPVLARARGELAWLSMMARDFAVARAHLDEAFVQARRAALNPSPEGGHQIIEPQLRAVAISLTHAQERHVEAKQQALEALASLECMAVPMLHDRYIFLEGLTMACLAIGELDEATRAAEQALKCAIDLGMPRLQLGVLCKMASISFERDDIAGAGAAVAHAADVMRVSPSEHWRPELLRLQAMLAQRRGNVALAREAFGESIELSGACGQLDERDIARSQLALLELHAGHAAAARDAVRLIIGGDAPRSWREIHPAALANCLTVLEAEGDDVAPRLRDHLIGRLQDQQAQMSDDDARRRLVEHVSHWRSLRHRS